MIGKAGKITQTEAGNITRTASSPYQAGDVVTYNCAPGYTLIGKRTNICMGQMFAWKYPDAPICVLGKV